MHKEECENVEIYFICYKKEKMNIVETYYDEILNKHCWYFNAYLAYKYWRRNFKKIEIDEMGKKFLTVAASKYILYKLENKEYASEKEHKKLLKELQKINPKLEEIINESNRLFNLK